MYKYVSSRILLEYRSIPSQRSKGENTEDTWQQGSVKDTQYSKRPGEDKSH